MGHTNPTTEANGASTLFTFTQVGWTISQSGAVLKALDRPWTGLVHRGWRKAELKKGDQATVEGYGAKDGSDVANARTVTMPDGRKLFGGFQTIPAPPSSSRASGVQ
jgi:hypothetical protein